MVTVERRGHGPTDLLHRVVRQALPQLREVVEGSDRQLPSFVWRELEQFNACGDPRRGFAWLWCRPCEHHRLVPFSCGGRGFCPSCGGRRMASLAAHWVDHVLPEVGLRQWVVTVPWSRRWLLARRPDLARGVLAVAIRTITRFLTGRAAKRGHAGGRTGSLTVVQRFGSALNLNLHFHILCLDGVYVRQGDGLRFVRDQPPSTEEVEQLVIELAMGAERWLARQGHGPHADGEEGDPDDALSLMQAASVAGRSAVEGGRRARRVQVHRGRAYALPPRCATFEGYSLHGGVAVGGRDAGGRERLCRYLARPALARTRLEETPAGLVRLTFKQPWSDGTAGLTFTPLELVERLASLVPPPRAHLVHFHGVLAGRSAWRREVVPRRSPTEEPPRPALAVTRTQASPRYRTWAELLWRVFAVDGWRCPHCGGPLALRAVPWPRATLHILDGLDAAAARAPPAPVAVPA